MKKTFIALTVAASLLSPVAAFALNQPLINANGTINVNYGGGPGSQPYTTYYPVAGGQSFNSFSGGSGGYGTSCTPGSLTLCSVINRIIGYLNQALFLLVGLSVVVFVYYVFHYFIKPDTDKKEAATYVLYSVIGFFVILSMWGLVNILQNTFGLGNSGFAHSSWYDISNIFPR